MLKAMVPILRTDGTAKTNITDNQKGDTIMIYLLTKLASVWPGKSGWGSNKEAEIQKSYYRGR